MATEQELAELQEFLTGPRDDIPSQRNSSSSQSSQISPKFITIDDSSLFNQYDIEYLVHSLAFPLMGRHGNHYQDGFKPCKAILLIVSDFNFNFCTFNFVCRKMLKSYKTPNISSYLMIHP